jgi:hypothetical protein
LDRIVSRLQFASFPGQESKILQNGIAIFTEVLPIFPPQFSSDFAGWQPFFRDDYYK